MKKILYSFMIIALACFSGDAFAQGLETFANFPETTNAYKDGTFVGQDGSTWTYKQCRGDSTINAPTPCLRKYADATKPAGNILSGTIHNGCGVISFDYKQPFTSNVNVDLLINGTVVKNIKTTGEQGVVKNSGQVTVNVSGDFTIEFRQYDNVAGQVMIDNVTWTSYQGTTKPEPTNYPTNFKAVVKGTTIELTWDDATGGQLPDAYLILAYEKTQGKQVEWTNPPVDGVYQADDVDLTNDDHGIKNVAYGVKTYTFEKVKPGYSVEFYIYPYTNSGSNINYKTDGTAPSADVTSSAVVATQNFSNGLTPWTQFSVLGNVQKWDTIARYGINNSPCAKMTGYIDATTTEASEDWLISPSFAIEDGQFFSFYSAMNYGSGDNTLTVWVSSNYTSGDPTTATWTEYTNRAILSTGSFTWVNSGQIDLADFANQSNVHIAFKYTCGTTNARTWEIDDFTLTKPGFLGIPSLTEAGFKLYPNPCSEQFIIENQKTTHYKVTVYSMQGIAMLRAESSDAIYRMDASKLKPGVYIVEVLDRATNIKATSRLVVR